MDEEPAAMARVRFVTAFLWKPARTWAIAYPGGGEPLTVTRACATAAIAAGAAVEIETFARDADAPPEPPKET